MTEPILLRVNKRVEGNGSCQEYTIRLAPGTRFRALKASLAQPSHCVEQLSFFLNRKLVEAYMDQQKVESIASQHKVNTMVVFARPVVDRSDKGKGLQRDANDPQVGASIDTFQVWPPVPNSTEEKVSKQKRACTQTPPLRSQDPFPIPLTAYRAMYECPIARHIMVEPVVASDGHVYDRSAIEEWCRVRKSEMLAATSQTNEDDSVCCGFQRKPLRLTSPVTGQPINGTLTPVYVMEQLIQRGVATNAFEMTPEELDEWNERREAKIARVSAARSQHDYPEDEQIADATSNHAVAVARTEDNAVSVGNELCAGEPALPSESRDDTHRQVQGGEGTLLNRCQESNMVHRLRQKCQSLERQYEACFRRGAPNQSNRRRLQYAKQLSRLWNNVETTRLELAEADSIVQTYVCPQSSPRQSCFVTLCRPIRQRQAEQRRRKEERRQAKERCQAEERRREEELRLAEQEERRKVARVLNDARKCAKCGAGPMIKVGCNDMRAHNNRSWSQVRGSNACPNCGHLTARWTENPPYYEPGRE